MINRPVLLAVGQETLDWIRQGGRTTRAHMMERLLMPWQSLCFEYNRSIQRRLYPQPWFGDNPVFILGLWRSGTTFMHELLGACPQMIWPSTWQCMNASSPVRYGASAVAKKIKRGMDDFTIDPLSPQEDEFALLTLGVQSVYRAFFDPRRLHEVAQWLSPDFWETRSNCWMETWRRFLAMVADGKEGKMLLKSPNHTFRLPALMREFPNASYVWVVRNPAETFLSNRKMWLSMFERYSLWEWKESELDTFLEKAFQFAGESLQSAVSSLSTDKLVVVDFEQLLRSPTAVVKAISERLDLGPWDTMVEFVDRAAAARQNCRRDLYAVEALRQVSAVATAKLQSVQKTALQSHGLIFS